MDLLGMSMRWPIIGAPMAGGPSNPELAAAVTNAGGLGFLAAGYRTPRRLGEEIADLRRMTSGPFGVNLFVPQDPTVDRGVLDAYVDSLQPEAAAAGVEAVAVWDDDSWSDKLDLLVAQAVPLVSFTFGCPPPSVITRLHRAGSMVAVTVTDPAEARLAEGAGADAVAAQGTEAGGHQGSFTDDVPPDTGWGLLALITAVRHAVDLPVLAAGGLMTGRDVAAARRAGANAAVLGTALLRTPESGASAIHKAALGDPGFAGTALTRAFSGRRARGLVNGFMRAHPDAPSGYPYINNATRALRRAALDRHDPHGINLWAGQGFRLAEERPAADIVARIGAEFDAVDGAVR
jgi:nitronate monooxygenase